MDGLLRRVHGRPRREPFHATRSRCGDGRLDPGAGEQCDGGIVCPGTAVCPDDCRCEPGTATTTTSTITTTTSLPIPACGNDRREPGEVCDGTDLAGETCPDGGLLACAADCRSLDTRGCFVCGNFRREGGEECDGHDLGGFTCAQAGETGGRLQCTIDCRFDWSECSRCGNRRVEFGEQCDDGNFVAGDGCSPDCRDECGNGILDLDEECDDANRIPDDGCHFCFLDPVYRGGGDEPRDCALKWGVTGAPPAGPPLACVDGNPSCDRGDVAGECLFHVSICFNHWDTVYPDPPCYATDIARVELTGASLEGPSALGAAVEETLLAVLVRTLGRSGSAVTRTGVRLDVTPPLVEPWACGFLPLPVPGGEERTISLRATELRGTVDDDELTFRCDSP